MRCGRRLLGVSPRWGLPGRAIPWALVALGCTTVSQTPSQSALMQATQTKASVVSLRASQNILAQQVPGTFEAAADSIAAQAPDARTRRRALLWKLELVPAFYEALFNADPLAAAMDTYTLCLQVEAYSETGAAREDFGPLQPIAVQAAKRARTQIEDRLKAIVATPEGFERAKAFAEKWASAHPIAGPPLSSRPSVLADLAAMAAAGGDKDVSVFQVVGDLPATVEDLAARMDIYAAYLPKAGRWQGELLVDELTDRTDAQRVLATFASVQQMTDRTSQLMSPEALQHALDVGTETLRKERLAVFAGMETVRKEMEDYVTGERVAVLAGVGHERQAALADVDRQRLALLEQMDGLRKQSVADADALLTRIIWRGALAVAVLIVLAAGVTTLVLRHLLKVKA